VAAAAWLATAAPAAAQAPLFRGSVEAVRVDVSVTRGGHPVSGLTAAHVEVLDNGVPQVVDRVSREDVPLNLMLVLDSSGSLAGEPLAALVDAARGLVRALRPDDRVGLLAFSQRLDLPVAPTVRHEEVLAAAASPTPGRPRFATRSSPACRSCRPRAPGAPSWCSSATAATRPAGWRLATSRASSGVPGSCGMPWSPWALKHDSARGPADGCGASTSPGRCSGPCRPVADASGPRLCRTS